MRERRRRRVAIFSSMPRLTNGEVTTFAKSIFGCGYMSCTASSCRFVSHSFYLLERYLDAKPMARPGVPGTDVVGLRAWNC
jgi:hypothetical protein